MAWKRFLAGPMPDLTPLPGFDWMGVHWGAPDERVSEQCCYCDEPIPEDDMPLMMMTEGGYVASFCRGCQKKWWGLQSFDDGPGDKNRDPSDANG